MLKRLLKLFGGRKGGATRGGKGGSHVHKRGKRRANKSIRKCPADLHLYGIDWGMDDDPSEGDR